MGTQTHGLYFMGMVALLLVGAAAIAAAEEDAIVLDFDAVYSASISSTADSVELVVYVPINEDTNMSNPVTVTTYVVNGQSASTPLNTRWPTVYFSDSREPGPTSVNATISTKPPTQSQVITASAANYQIEQEGASVDVYRFYIGVWCPDLGAGDTSDITVSVTQIEDLMGDIWSVGDAGAYVLRGTLASGIRRYFAVDALPPSEIIIEMCTSSDRTGNDNPTPLAFLFNRFTDVDSDAFGQDEGVQWPTTSCQATYNAVSAVTDPSMGADGYLQVCPLYVSFSTTVSPATFALDVSYWWNYAPVINGTLSYTISVQPVRSVIMPATVVMDYPYSHVVGFQMTQDGADLIVDFPLPSIVDEDDGVHDLVDGQFALYADVIYDELAREELENTRLFNNGCFLAQNSAMQVSEAVYGEDLQVGDVDGYRRLTATNFFKDLKQPDQVPFHVNIGVGTTDFGSLAYSYQLVANTGGLTSSFANGLGGWAIFGIVIGSLSVVAVILGAGIFVAYVFIKKRNANANYEVME